MLSIGRRIIKRFHPEGIPWPMSHVYSLLSASNIFQAHYALCARDVISRKPSGKLLDVGTGPGWLLCHFAQEAPAMELFGVDISKAMVEKARANMAKKGLSGRVALEQGNAGNLPFPDSSFDVVLSTGSMHHWKDPIAGLDEIHRVLKDDGVALIYDLVSRTPVSVLREAAKKYGRMRITLMWLHSFEEPFYSPEQMESLAENSLFGKGETSFVGVMCCLEMKKS